MGCRTRANEYYNTGRTAAIDGNAARKTAPKQRKAATPRTKRRGVSASLAAMERRQKRHLVILGTICAVTFIGLCTVLLGFQGTRNAAALEMKAKESEYENKQSDNDAREYEINNSVDLDYIIDMAVNDLGMVRSNASQIIMFTAKDSEYIQQVAQVPVN